MKHLKLSLRENAHSFLEDALANAVVAEEEPARWKFAVLSMVQAIELSLKQLLFNVHPLFVFENINKATKTVGLELAVRRLGLVANLRLTRDESEALRVAKEARDQITHYAVDQDVEHLKLSFSRLLGFLADFYEAHFHVPLYDHVDEQLWSKGLAVQQYGKELHERAMVRAKGICEPITSCPACSWRPMVVSNETGDGTCYVCGFRTTFCACARCRNLVPDDDTIVYADDHYCRACIEHVSTDYWFEHSAGK